MSEKAFKFLEAHRMSAKLVIPSLEADKMKEDMVHGLKGEKSAMPMIPAYLSNEGSIKEGESAVVIDAGGTNFRAALLRYENGGFITEGSVKSKMPGIDKPADWEEFVAFTADKIMPFMDKTDKIGFCFSYSADITPEIDGKVNCIDKEVTISNSAGKLVGTSLVAELEKRGFKGKRAVILNDTVAVLLGGAASIDKSAYSGFAGQVSGTGTNTCCSLPISKIEKLNRDEDKSILVNLESGMYDGLVSGDFDIVLDKNSANPGSKKLEKMTSGVYLGELFRLMIKAAAEEGLLSEAGSKKALTLGKTDAGDLDAWSCGERLEEICGNKDDEAFVITLAKDIFERSARCMCTNLLAIMLLTGEGTDKNKPFCVCAEGSLVQKGRNYRPVLEQLLKEEGEKLGLYAELRVGDGSTMPGSAAAAILNI